MSNNNDPRLFMLNRLYEVSVALRKQRKEEKKYEKYFFNWMIISNDTLSVIGIMRLGKPEMENGKFKR